MRQRRTGRAAAARGAHRQRAVDARAAGAWGRWALGRARQAHELGARAGFGLCTRCTRPVFDPD